MVQAERIFIHDLMSMGNLGAVIATTPLAWSVDVWGWRITFHVIGGITLILAFVALVFTKDKQEPQTPAVTTDSVDGVISAGSSIFQILASSRLWAVSMRLKSPASTAWSFP